jgi:signal transduction histidine kinase
MQDRVRRLLHDRTQMLAAISHDLRTPITRLQLRAEYLQGTNQYDKAIADLKEMENMISSILSFARDHVRSENMERFDLNALLQTLCDDLADVGSHVVYHSELQRMPYFGRIVALKRAINNLIENAVKYGDRAEVSLKQTDKELQIRISDEGPGIPQDQLEKVFAPFYRVDTARSPKKSGTGLGLAVARDIIRAHGGEIRLYNREPHGLTAVISLPRQES